MGNENTVGYSKEEYYKISSKEGLPKRCPILGKCCKAVWTRYVLGFRLVGEKSSLEDFVSFEGQYWEPDKMIQTVEQMEWSQPGKYGNYILIFASNICPEVTLFEEKYLPQYLTPSACGDISYYSESKRSEVEPKHYSECAEFSDYYLKNIRHSKDIKKTTPKKRKRSHISNTMKIEIFQRDGFRCYYCKKHKDELPSGVHLTLDHKIPHVDGGDDSFNNLVAACSDCNGGKSNKVINDI